MRRRRRPWITGFVIVPLLLVPAASGSRSAGAQPTARTHAAAAIVPLPGETITGRISMKEHEPFHSVHGGDGYADFTYTAVLTMTLSSLLVYPGGWEAMYSGSGEATWKAEGFAPNDVNLGRNCRWSFGGTDRKVTATIDWTSERRGEYAIDANSPTIVKGKWIQCTLPPNPDWFDRQMPLLDGKGASLQPELKGSAKRANGTAPYISTVETTWDFSGSFQNGWKNEAMRRAARITATVAGRMFDVTGFVAGGAGLVPGGQLVAAFFFGSSLAAYLGRDLANWIADDPPDPNYRAIARPRKPAVVAFPKRGLSPDVTRALDIYLRTVAEFQAYFAAFTTSSERAAGVKWKDPAAATWWRRQETAAATYAKAAGSRLRKLLTLQRRLASALGPDAKRTLTPEQIARARDQVRHQGLPAVLSTALKRLGASAAQIQELRAEISRTNATAPPSVETLLRSRNFDRYEEEMDMLGALLQDYPRRTSFP